MSRMHFRRAGVLAAAALAALAGCAKDPDILLAPSPAGNASFMARYVAIGNSITAGFQSGGIGATTQAAAYPALIARALGLGATYSGPYLVGPGCAPMTDPVNAFLAATGTSPARTSTVCARTSTTTFLNNVAVPGATSANVTNQPGSSGNPLTTLILGGRTQVEIAAAEQPTFISVWIGNNDVLGAALAGATTRATPLATFQANYDKMLAGLASTPAVQQQHGILIGVVDVTNVPSVFTAQAIVNNIGGFRTAIEQGFLGGHQFQILPNCTANTTTGVSLGYLLTVASTAARLPAGTPIPFACAPITIPGIGTIGTDGILDPVEAATLSARVAAFNAYIAQKANAMGWAYLDPNTLLAQLKTQPGQISPIPNLTSTTAPFGLAISLDGIHPSSSAHVLIANGIIAAINAKYGTNIPTATAAQ